MWANAVTSTGCPIPARGVITGLAGLMGDRPGAAPAAIAHGTTIVTNAVVEGKGARTAVVTTRGFRDVLEIARQSRLDLYRLDVPPRPAPLVPRSKTSSSGSIPGPSSTTSTTTRPSCSCTSISTRVPCRSPFATRLAST